MTTDSPAAAPSAKPDAPELPLAPQARVEASRAALRLAMLPAVAAAENSAKPTRGRALLVARVEALRRYPWVSTLTDTVRQWWATRSWRPLVAVGVEAGGRVVLPIARRHPMRLLAAALVSGAILSRWRTWKWILATTVPALAASLLPTLISRLASRLPLSTLLNLVGVSRPVVSPVTVPVPVAVVTVPVPAKPAGADR